MRSPIVVPSSRILSLPCSGAPPDTQSLAGVSADHEVALRVVRQRLCQGVCLSAASSSLTRPCALGGEASRWREGAQRARPPAVAPWPRPCLGRRGSGGHPRPVAACRALSPSRWVAAFQPDSHRPSALGAQEARSPPKEATQPVEWGPVFRYHAHRVVWRSTSRVRLLPPPRCSGWCLTLGMAAGMAGRMGFGVDSSAPRRGHGLRDRGEGGPLFFLSTGSPGAQRCGKQPTRQ